MARRQFQLGPTSYAARAEGGAWSVWAEWSEMDRNLQRDDGFSAHLAGPMKRAAAEAMACHLSLADRLEEREDRRHRASPSGRVP